MTDQVVKALLDSYAPVLKQWFQEVIYDTIPDGDVLKRVHQVKYGECEYFWTGCRYCLLGEDSLLTDAKFDYWLCKGKPCPICKEENPPGPHCVAYKCPTEEEMPFYHTDQGEPLLTKPYKTNLVCGTTLNVTVAGCYCKPEYQWRDKGSLRCVKSC
jgi:hypothetical protein